MNILIKDARVINPATGLDKVQSVLISNGRVARMGEVPDQSADRTIEAKGWVLAPGLVDLCARLKEPGQEHARMLESELSAAAAGGVTSLACPPDTDPVLDEPGLVDMLKARARKLSRCRLFPVGALTRGLSGDVLTEMAELTEAGCIGFSQAEKPIRDTLVLMRALQYAATYGYTAWLRPQDPWLGNGMAASGPIATRLGLSGVPVASETLALHTIFELMRVTGAKVHLCRLSSAAGVALVRAAKAEGLPVTADVSINSLMFTDTDIGYFDTSLRLNPPVRQARDKEALHAGLVDGTIDALVSDHNPVDADAKTLPFGEAEPGATGLELLLSVALKWGESAGWSLPQTLSLVTHRPAGVLGGTVGPLSQSLGQVVEGGMADLCLFDPEAEWPVRSEALRSQGKHTPFDMSRSGMRMPGRVKVTLVAGHIAYEDL